MTRVYIIRHAEAEGNLYRRIHGQYNSNLTALGVKQLDALEKRFSDVEINKVYSSDLKRTMMTSTAITRSRGISAEPERQFREIFMGRWEDLEWGNAEKYDREQLVLFSVDPAEWKIDGSEKFYELRDRVLRAVIDKAAKNKNGTIAIFSHGAAIRALTSAILGVPSDEIQKIKYCDNTAVMALDVEGESIDLLYEGDDSHITEEYTRFRRQSWHKDGGQGLDASNLRIEVAGSQDISRAKDWFPNGAWSAISGDQVSAAFREDELIGIVAVDTVKYVNKGVGVIDLCCFSPEWREKRYLPQLIGRAVSQCRASGLKTLSLGVAENSVIDKFLHLGFERSQDEGISCCLDLTV